jgi:hypothetical protein
MMVGTGQNLSEFGTKHEVACGGENPEWVMLRGRDRVTRG